MIESALHTKELFSKVHVIIKIMFFFFGSGGRQSQVCVRIVLLKENVAYKALFQMVSTSLVGDFVPTVLGLLGRWGTTPVRGMREQLNI